jgi:hypothetical protein
MKKGTKLITLFTEYMEKIHLGIKYRNMRNKKVKIINNNNLNKKVKILTLPSLGFWDSLLGSRLETHVDVFESRKDKKSA